MLLITATLALASCKNKSDESATFEEQTNQTESSTDKNQNEKRDSRQSNPQDVKITIDNINTRVSELENILGDINKTLDGKISNNSNDISDNSFKISIAMIIAMLGFLMAFIAMLRTLLKKKNTSGKNRLYEVEREVDYLKTELNNIKPSNSNLDILNLKRQVAELEGKLYKLSLSKKQSEQTVSTQLKMVSDPPRMKEPVKEQAVKGYFGIPSRGGEMGYFKSVSEQRDSDSRFEAEITGKVAQFKPIVNSEAAIKTLFSSDYAKGAYEIIGDPNSGKKNPVVTAGIAIEEGGMWKIKEKAKLDFK